MKIAIIADIHENFHNLTLFYRQAEKLWIEKILCLWDLINGWIAMVFAQSKIPTFMVWWNNDWDKVFITKTACKKGSNLEVWFDTFDTIELDNRKIFLSHYPMLAKPMAKSWDFDLVCYWHNHTMNLDKIWDCFVVNPWQLWSVNWAFALYDTKLHEIEIIKLEWCISLKSDLADNYRKEIWVKRPKDKSREY